MNKKGIELAVNFMTGVVIGVVLLTLGLLLLYKIIGGAQDIRIPSFIEREIAGCHGNDENVCIPVIKQDINKGSTKSFWIGIKNNAVERDISLVLDFSMAQDAEGNPLPSQDSSKWSFSEFKRTLNANEESIVAIPMKPPEGTKPGIYVFNVNVCSASEENPQPKCPASYKSLFSPTQKISVVVP